MKKPRPLSQIQANLKKNWQQKEKLHSELWQRIHLDYQPLQYNDPVFQTFRVKLVLTWEDEIKAREVSLNKAGYKIKSDSLKDAIDSLAYDYKHRNNDFDTFLQCVESLSHIENQIANAMDNSDVEWGRSDDGFSDFTNSLVLVDTLIIGKLLRKEYKSNTALEKDIRKHHPIWFSQAVTEGENYIDMICMQIVEEYI